MLFKLVIAITNKSYTALLIVLLVVFYAVTGLSTVITLPCVYFNYLISFQILWGAGNIDGIMIKDPTPNYLRAIYLRGTIEPYLPIKYESILEKLIFLFWSHGHNKLKICDRNTL